MATHLERKKVARLESGVRRSFRRCPICAERRTCQLFPVGGFPLWRCLGCQVRFLDPQPDEATLRTIYTGEYFLGEPTPRGRARVLALKRGTAGVYLDMVKRLRGTEGGRLLEIGCGRGELLREAHARGYVVDGVELIPAAAAIANRLLGMDRVVASRFEEVSLRNAAYDVVVAADVLEHVRDPLALLGEARRLLLPGGLLFVVTPYVESISSRLLGRHWMEYKPEHLFYFGRRSLTVALRRAGFVNVTFHPNVKVLSLDYLYHHFRRFPVPIATPVLRFARSVTPGWLAHRPLRLGGSGIIATARS